MIPTPLYQALKKLNPIVKYYHADYYAEMEGVSKYSGIELDDIVLANFIYEIDSYCTAFLTKDVNGNIYHHRMLDFYFPNESKAIVYIGEF